MDLSAIGRQFGLDDAQTRAAMEALAPVVAAGLRQNAQTPQGLQDILTSVVAGGHARSFDDPSALQYDNAKAPGEDVLGQIFGSKDVSRGVAQQLSATSGVGAAVLKKLLPIVASIVMAQVARTMAGGGASGGNSGGGLGDILGDVLGGGASRQAPSSGGGGLGDILGDILTGGQGGAQRQAPEDQSPQGGLGDILKDILGGGVSAGTDAPAPESVNRGRKALDDILGGGTQRGSDADILLNSVRRSIGR